MKLTKSFVLSEFNCNDGTPVPPELVPNVIELSKQLQALRDDIGEPLTILSGFRTVAWNARVGGKVKSQHLYARAADLTCKSLKPRELKARIEKLIKAKKMKDGGIGLYPGFVHYDIGPARRW
jgi:uncharacterized protein YcbK (DUF882 family)